MNRGVIRYILGRMLLIEAGLMLFPLGVGFIYRESAKTIGAFLIIIAALTGLGAVLGWKKPKNTHLYAKEGMVIASLSWFILSFFGALPFYVSGEVSSLIDAFFEAASGFTTTGSSILTNVEALSHSLLYWRSFTHLIGGMGVLVFALALLPKTSSDSVNIMQAEVPGPVFGKLVSKLRDSARILYVIYLVMTVILIGLLMLGGMDWFEASISAFGAAGTGGFSDKNLSIAYYNSAYIDYTLGIAMIAFGLNFNLYYLLLIRQVKKAYKNEEMRWYLAIILAATVLIAINISGQYDSVGRVIRDAFFAVSSIITTTGYATADFGQWPLLSHVILLLLMFFGACAGSTGGGLKISRVAVLIKTAVAEVRRSRDPNRAITVKFENSPLDNSTTRSIAHYFLVYTALFILLVLLVSIDIPDFVTAFSAVAATYNNIGPGLALVGPTSNFAAFSDFTKLTLSVAMIAGRLEIYPVLILFLPSTWRKRG